MDHIDTLTDQLADLLALAFLALAQLVLALLSLTTGSTVPDQPRNVPKAVPSATVSDPVSPVGPSDFGPTLAAPTD